MRSSHLKKFFLGFRWAGAGLIYAFKSQRNMRIHGIAALMAAILSFLLRLDSLEWAILILTCGLVWMAELFNTALEVTLDYLAPEIHPQIKIAKDVAAAAVLVAALVALGIGLCLWGPKLGFCFFL